MDKILDFAQLSLDIYDDEKNISLKSNFDKNWVRVKNSSDDKSGFYAALYLNELSKVGVICVRGTDNHPDVIADIGFSIYKGIKEQYKELLDFISMTKHSSWYKNYNIKYCTGHSLGGILAKAISPESKLNTIAFNSSGVKAYLYQHHMYTGLSEGQYVITYSATGDFVGHLRTFEDTKKEGGWDLSEDLGKHIYLPVNNHADKLVLKDATSQHSMKNMYLFLSQTKQYIYVQ